MLEKILKEILIEVVNDGLEQKAEACLEKHKDCLEANIREAIEAGMPADKVAEIAFKIGYAHGVMDYAKHVEE